MLMFSAPRNRRRMALSNRLIRYSELKTPVKKTMKNIVMNEASCSCVYINALLITFEELFNGHQLCNECGRFQLKVRLMFLHVDKY